MMRIGTVPAALAVLLLSGCDARIGGGDRNKGEAGVAVNVAGGQISLDTEDLQAKLKLPKLDLDAARMDIDGVKLYPGTKVGGIDVQAQDAAAGDGEGKVTIAFTSADPPATLLDYYRKAFSDRNYSVAAATAGELALAAAKPRHKDVHVAVHPEGAGSAGTIVVSGD